MPIISLILTSLLYLILLIIIIITIFFVTPLSAKISVKKDEKEKITNLSLKTFAGLITIERTKIKDQTLIKIYILSKKIKTKKTEEKQIKPKKQMKKTKEFDNSLILELIPEIPDFIKNLIKKFEIEWIKMNITIGFENPAKTGIITGNMYALKETIQIKYPKSEIKINPDFDGKKLSYKTDIKINIKHLRMILMIKKFLLTKKGIKLAKEIIF